MIKLKTLMEAGRTGLLTIYQGRSVYNKGSKYFTTNKEWAQQFTQSGKENEITVAQIDPKVIYVDNPLPQATNEKILEKTIEVAKAKNQGYKAIWVDEGIREPRSIFILDWNAVKILKPSIIKENIEDTTFKMYHGGKRWTRLPTEIIPTKKGRYEVGIGIYLTNNYETARKYGKGNRVVHLVYVNKNFKDISEVRISLQEVISFLKNLSGLRHRQEIINSITDIASRSNDNTISAEILNNCVVNYGVGNVGIKISNYFVSKGIDACLQKQDSGEVWLVVFNPNIIKKVEIVNPAKITSGFEFMLPQIIRENEEESEIDQDKLYWNESYLDNVAEKLGYSFNFNTSFWQYPQRLYHCTKQEYVPLIQQKGLLKRSDTRGINNRSVGSAVFTVIEDEIEYMKQYYGPVVIVINTKAMKADNYTPTVEREPDWERAEKLAFVYNKLNPGKEKYPEQFIDSSDGVTQGTVIIFGNIPPKYLSISE